MSERIAEVEARLAELQRATSGREARSLLFSLVIVSTPEQESEALQVPDSLLGTRPARVVHVVVGGKENGAIPRMRCVPDQNDRALCVQELVIPVPPGQEVTSGFWIPFTLRDMPVYGVWLAAGTSSAPQLREFADHVDALLVDSEQLTDGVSGGACLAARRAPPVALDRSWLRVRNLRELAAELFDPPGHRPYLEELSRVTVGELPDASIAYVAAWLAVALDRDHLRRTPSGWQVAGTDALDFTVAKSADRKTVIAFETHSGETISAERLDEGCLRLSGPELDRERPSPRPIGWIRTVEILEAALFVANESAARLRLRAAARLCDAETT